MAKTKLRRNLKWIALSIALLIVVGFFGGRYFLLAKIRDTLHKRLGELRANGIYIRFKSAEINTWSGDLEINSLEVQIGDTVNRDISAIIPLLRVQGFQIIPFLKERTISINDVEIRQPEFTFRLTTQFPKSETRNAAFEDIYIKNISMPGASLHLKDSTSQDTLANVKSDLYIGHLGLVRMKDSLAWRQSAVRISDFSFEMPNENYGFSVKDVRLDLKGRSFEVDTLKFTPNISRRKFMLASGKQTDYMKGVIPYIRVSGATLQATPQGMILNVGKFTTQMFMEVYRDKRLPFIKDHKTTLPNYFVQKLPFKFKLDTLRLDESLVSYEEFPEKGDSSGAVYFDKLEATAFGISNMAGKDHKVILHARTKFMGKGDLSVDFTFPTDTTKPCSTRGNLKNFPLVKLNDMLGPAAKAQVQSGTMTNMKFSFLYNAIRSDGEVELNYEDLRIVSLRQNSKKEVKVSLIKTLLLNTFIIRKDMDEDVKDDKKTGTVLFYRDQKKSIFNYWWKSVFSGIKSAYKIDKLENVAKDLKSNKNLKKKKHRSSQQKDRS